MEKKKANKEKEQYFIPMEITRDTIITNEYQDSKIRWSKIGNRMVRTILIPATKDQYEAYMRPEWRDDKRKQRLAEKRQKREKAQVERRVDKSIQGWDTAVSFEMLCDLDYGFSNESQQDSLEEIVEKKEMLEALQRELAKLKDLDRTILAMAAQGISEAAIARKVGLSQKGVNKRKHRLFELLRERLLNYR